MTIQHGVRVVELDNTGGASPSAPANDAAPVITSAATGSAGEDGSYAIQLTANVPVVFLKRGGGDGDAFALSGARLSLLPGHDAGAASLTCPLRAVDTWGNSTDFTHVVSVEEEVPPGPSLKALLLSGTSFVAGAAAGTLIGAISNATAGSAITVDDSRLAISGTQLLVGLTEASEGTIEAHLIETLAGAIGSPRTTPIEITVTAAPIALADLTLDTLEAAAGAAWSAAILGKTAGSTVTASASDDTVLTVSGSTVGGIFAAEGSPTVTLTETLATAVNSPHTSPAIGLSVAAAPAEAPTVLTAPTITLDGTTATIVLGAFEGATSESHILLVDGVPLPDPAVAGDLDVTAYAGMALKVVSSGTNAGGTVFSPSDPVDVPALGYSFRNAGLTDTYAVDTDAATIPGLVQMGGLPHPDYVTYKVRASGAIGMDQYAGPGLLVHDSDGVVEVEIDAYSAGGATKVALFAADKDNLCFISAGSSAAVNVAIVVRIAGSEQFGDIISGVDISAPGTWLKAVKTGPTTVDVYRRPPAGAYAKIGSLDTASSAAGDVSGALGNYFGVGVQGTIDPLPDFSIFSGAAPAVSVGEIAEAEPTAAGRHLTVPVTYTGSPANLQVGVYGPNGAAVVERYTAVATPSGGSASIGIDMPSSVSGTVTVAVYAGASSVFGAGSVALIPWSAPPATVLGVNFHYPTGYSGNDLATNLLEVPGSVRDAGQSAYFSSAISPTTKDQTGVLPMDTSGAIIDYPTLGGVKQTSLKFSVDSVRGGTYTVTAPPGMTASPTTITIPDGGYEGGVEHFIGLSGPIPAGGIKVGPPSDANFKCLLNGGTFDPIPDNSLRDGYELASVVRWMTPLAVNEVRPRTLTAADALYDGPASQGFRSFRAICDYSNTIYTKTGKVVSPWINIHGDSDASYMAAVAAYMYDHLNPAIPLRVEYTNESWNWGFAVKTWLHKMGYNAGYSATDPTPQSVADFQSQTSDGSASDRYPAIAYATGTKVFAHTDSLDFVGVWVAQQDVPATSTGALPSTSAGNAYWSYETSDHDATGMGYAARKYKAFKERQMIDAFKGAFTGADRARLILHHATWFLEDPAQTVEDLRMFDNHLDWDEWSNGCYWGTPDFGVSIDLYTYGYANTGQALTPSVQALYTAFDGGSSEDQETFKAAWFSTANAAVDAALSYLLAKKKAVRNGIGRDIAYAVYEGNYDMSFPSYSNAAAAKAMRASLLDDDRMTSLITHFMEQWQALFGGLFCWFAHNAGLMSESAAGNYWSVREKSGIDTKHSLALKEFQASLIAAS